MFFRQSGAQALGFGMADSRRSKREAKGKTVEATRHKLHHPNLDSKTCLQLGDLKVKQMQKCLKPAFFLKASRWRLHWLQKDVRFYEILSLSL